MSFVHLHQTKIGRDIEHNETISHLLNKETLQTETVRAGLEPPGSIPSIPSLISVLSDIIASSDI